MMTIKSFDKVKHYELLVSWWKQREHPVFPVSDLPDTGFMAYWEDKPICCGFLVLTNSHYVMAEAACASPEASYEDRELALAALSDAMCACAEELGFTKIISIVHKERLAEKAPAMGYRVVPNAYLCVKEL